MQRSLDHAQYLIGPIDSIASLASDLRQQTNVRQLMHIALCSGGTYLFDRTGSYTWSFSLSMAVLALATTSAWLAGRWGGAQMGKYG
jgi:hypothetical protein